MSGSSMRMCPAMANRVRARVSSGYDSTAYWARSGLMATMHYAGTDPVP